MGKIERQINKVTKSEISDAEKIEALQSLLTQYETEAKKIESNLSTNVLKNMDIRSSFYAKQLYATVIAGIVTMATAAKSLEISSSLNDILFAISATITAAGIGSMTLEELGVPIVKEDRLAKKQTRLAKASTKIKQNIEELSENQPQ